ncbi:hypothetical protein AGRO_1038 [Agrobacterium sp. ATCC 31749]|nr:hypothetical protein AGRO_1038 [Agrobacterium sp. ATCC 31749]
MSITTPESRLHYYSGFPISVVKIQDVETPRIFSGGAA